MKQKKSMIAVTLAVIGITGYSLVFAGEEDMKLVNKNSGFVVVEFVDHKPHFFDPVLEMQMKEHGIAVPLELRESFSGKERVYLGDEEFEKAFHELFCKYSFDDQVYKWETL